MKVGRNVVISPKASIYNPDAIEIGDNVRIDDFCILSGGSGLKIGSHIHIGAHSSFYGGSGIEIGDFCSFGAYNLIHSDSDNFDGTAFVGPVYPEKYKPGMKHGKVVLEKFVNFGAKVTVLPGVRLGEGAAVGACSLVMKDLDPWVIYAGSPVRKIRDRKKMIESYVDDFLREFEES